MDKIPMSEEKVQSIVREFEHKSITKQIDVNKNF
jgi:hypothetical protein